MAQDLTQKSVGGGGPARQETSGSPRRNAREIVFGLLFESEYHGEEDREAVLCRAAQDRDFDENDAYIRSVYLGVMEHLDEVDALIGRHARGWRTGRLSRVSRAIVRLSTYEMKYRPDIPRVISINEAVELSKIYDAPKARAFINGVLNAVKNELEQSDSESNGDRGADAPNHDSLEQ